MDTQQGDLAAEFVEQFGAYSHVRRLIMQELTAIATVKKVAPKVSQYSEDYYEGACQMAKQLGKRLLKCEMENLRRKQS